MWNEYEEERSEVWWCLGKLPTMKNYEVLSEMQIKVYEILS